MCTNLMERQTLIRYKTVYSELSKHLKSSYSEYESNLTCNNAKVKQTPQKIPPKKIKQKLGNKNK